MSELIECSHCGCLIENEVYEVEDDVLCENCYTDETFVCDCCGERFMTRHEHSDDNTVVCADCYENHYHRCTNCECLVHDNDVYWQDNYPYCSECCPNDENDDIIHSYYYKPNPVFYKCCDEKDFRYYGVELEIDKGGRDDEYAESLLDIANRYDDVLYIKSDGSLDEGMELVSQPCSLRYHRERSAWEDIMRRAVSLGYRSHNTRTCGLHVHIGRNELGETYKEQEEIISRIMFFFESHWNELFKFSRRSEATVDRWASRHGYNDRPKEILEKAKKSTKGRYACVNITNANTVEIRMFKGTLKWNTFMAALELVDAICDNAITLTDTEIHKQSWGDFVMNLSPEYIELIKYLKEKRLYVNEPVVVEEEV